MRTFSWRVLLFVLLAVLAAGTAVQAASADDPLVGEWLYHYNHPVTFYADGTARYQKEDRRGTWEYLHNPEVQRHYRVIWDQGKYIDLLILAEDDQRAHVVAQVAPHDQYDVRRAISDKPAAAADAASPPGVAAPPPRPSIPAAADPVVGEWAWLKGIKATFLANGTIKSPAGSRGTWEFLNNPEPERKYHVTLKPGKYTSDLLYDPIAGTARATNTEGKFFHVAKTEAVAAPPADKPPEGYFGAPGR